MFLVPMQIIVPGTVPIKQKHNYSKITEPKSDIDFRYPLHWHMCFDIGPNKYEDPSTFENNSIHHSFSEVFKLFFIQASNIIWFL